MFDRSLVLAENRSFFLLGPRGTGKSTLLRSRLSDAETWTLDLLNPLEEDVFIRNPMELERRVLELPQRIRWIVIDEIQKAPRLLDVVHRLIEKTQKSFALTGSSAIKLKRGASNLLAGRAFVHHLHPFTHRELGTQFELNEALSWGTLPSILRFQTSEDKAQYLRGYALTYLKEEIATEGVVRKLDPFRNFLEVAAQCNGLIVNYSGIAHDVGVDTKTIQGYFNILEETLIGMTLPAFHRSVRKRQRTNPKFYFFDTGVKRALERMLQQEIQPRTYAFGLAFEHFLILEIHRLAEYASMDWKLSYLRTKDDSEIDLIVERPGLKTALIEIKSSERVEPRHLTPLERFCSDFPDSEAFCLSLDPHPKKIGNVRCLPWKEGLVELGLPA